VKKQERKLSSAILAGTFITPAVMSVAQANVVSANFCKNLSQSVSSFFTKKAGESLLKYMATKILPCVIVVLGMVLIATIVQKQIKSSFKKQDRCNFLNRSGEKRVKFFEGEGWYEKGRYRILNEAEEFFLGEDQRKFLNKTEGKIVKFYKEEGRYKVSNKTAEGKLVKFFKAQDQYIDLNENVKKVINFLENNGELLGFKGATIEVPGSLVSKILYEDYDVFSKKPTDKNLEDAKKQNKVELKILRVFEEEKDVFCLKLKLKQNGAWLDKTYETRYINKKHLIEFFNYILEKASDTNSWEYKLKFKIKDSKAYLIKIKKETNEEVNKISIDEAEKNTAALESIVEFCYESKLQGIFEKTFIFGRTPEEFRVDGNNCRAIFLLLRKHAKELGIKLGDEDGMTFEVKGAEAVNFLKLDGIKDNVKNKLRNLEKVKLKILYIREEGDIALTMSKESCKFGGYFCTKYSTTNVGKIIDFANFLLSKANEERKDGVEFKLEKVVTGQSTHVKLVKTKNGVKEQEAFITKKLVDECKNLDDIFKEDLFFLNIEDEFNLNPDCTGSKDSRSPFELSNKNGQEPLAIKKLDVEEPFFEEDEKFELYNTERP